MTTMTKTTDQGFLSMLYARLPVLTNLAETSVVLTTALGMVLSINLLF